MQDLERCKMMRTPDPLMAYAIAFECDDDGKMQQLLQEHPGIEDAIFALHARYDGERSMPEVLIAWREQGEKW